MKSQKTDVILAEITLQPAAESDFAAWLPLWKSYQTFYRVDIPDTVTQLTWKRFSILSNPCIARWQNAKAGLWDSFTISSTALPGPKATTAIWKICSLIRPFGASISANG